MPRVTLLEALAGGNKSIHMSGPLVSASRIDKRKVVGMKLFGLVLCARSDGMPDWPTTTSGRRSCLAMIQERNAENCLERCRLMLHLEI